MIFGDFITALATHIFCCSPPLNSYGYLLYFLVKPIFCNNSLTFSLIISVSEPIIKDVRQAVGIQGFE